VGIPKIRSIASLGAPSSASIQKPVTTPIPLTPRGTHWGKKEDPLEAAAKQGVPGTLPERIVWKWLEDNDHLFDAQSEQGGGRLSVGGAVVDFLVYTLAGATVAIRVQGDYWHGPAFPERQARDDEQADRLRQWGYIVADLWEHDIYDAVLNHRLDSLIRDAVEGPTV
jgi:hypothetical protein